MSKPIDINGFEMAAEILAKESGTTKDEIIEKMREMTTEEAASVVERDFETVLFVVKCDRMELARLVVERLLPHCMDHTSLRPGMQRVRSVQIVQRNDRDNPSSASRYNWGPGEN